MTYDTPFLAWLDQSTLCDQHKTVARMRAKGMTQPAIAEDLDLSPWVIRQMCNRVEAGYYRHFHAPKAVKA